MTSYSRKRFICVDLAATLYCVYAYKGHWVHFVQRSRQLSNVRVGGGMRAYYVRTLVVVLCLKLIFDKFANI